MHVISRKVASIRGKKKLASFVCCLPDGRKRQGYVRIRAGREKPENQILILSYERVKRHAMPGRLY